MIKHLNPLHAFPNQDRMGFAVALLNQFSLRKEYREQLDSYYVLHWRTDYLAEKVTKPFGYIVHADIIYIPIWQLAVGSLLPGQQVKLSFRKVKIDLSNAYSAAHYVLIKAA